MPVFREALPEITGMRPPLSVSGTLIGMQGPVLVARLPQVETGAVCEVQSSSGNALRAHVLSFKDDVVTLAPFESRTRVSPGSEVRVISPELKVKVPAPGGAIVDALGEPFHGIAARYSSNAAVPIFGEAPPPLTRRPIREVYETGIRAIDTFLTVGQGQRVGLFAPPGIGKSTLLGVLARQSQCDVAVVALVGERGREVNEFIEEALGETGLKKTTLVVATSDESAFRRSLAAYTATAIAEAYRRDGANVLLLVDSLTRVARAIRELSLAAGELPVRQGYTARVYSELPQLVERSGNCANGTMTAFYTVLTNGPSDPDPLAEEIRSLLDGHIVLDDSIRRQGVRPAVDILGSCSRLFSKLNDSATDKTAETLRTALARLQKDKDFVLLGGTPDKELSAALALEADLMAFRNQSPREYTPRSEALRRAAKLADLL